jgi:hypothetical protein
MYSDARRITGVCVASGHVRHADWQVPRRAEFSDCKGQVLGAAMLVDSAMANNASSR